VDIDVGWRILRMSRFSWESWTSLYCSFRG
jgi:hypothetical protein